MPKREIMAELEELKRDYDPGVLPAKRSTRGKTPTPFLTELLESKGYKRIKKDYVRGFEHMPSSDEDEDWVDESEEEDNDEDEASEECSSNEEEEEGEEDEEEEEEEEKEEEEVGEEASHPASPIYNFFLGNSR